VINGNFLAAYLYQVVGQRYGYPLTSRSPKYFQRFILLH